MRCSCADGIRSLNNSCSCVGSRSGAYRSDEGIFQERTCDTFVAFQMTKHDLRSPSF